MRSAFAVLLREYTDLSSVSIGEVRAELEDLLELRRGDLDGIKDVVTRITQEVLVQSMDADSRSSQGDSDKSDESEDG